MSVRGIPTEHDIKLAKQRSKAPYKLFAATECCTDIQQEGGCLLIASTPDEVAVHGAILQLAACDAVQVAGQGGSIVCIGSVGFHTADWLPHKSPQGGLPPAAHHPIPASWLDLWCCHIVHKHNTAVSHCKADTSQQYIRCRTISAEVGVSNVSCISSRSTGRRELVDQPDISTLLMYCKLPIMASVFSTS